MIPVYANLQFETTSIKKEFKKAKSMGYSNAYCESNSIIIPISNMDIPNNITITKPHQEFKYKVLVGDLVITEEERPNLKIQDVADGIVIVTIPVKWKS